MPKYNLPTYAIVELLIRLAKYNASIGDYKNHSVYNSGVIVKTSGGTIDFTKSLISKQFEHPELITDADLAKVASIFKAVN